MNRKDYYKLYISIHDTTHCVLVRS